MVTAVIYSNTQKATAKIYEEYRSISLISYFLNAFLRVIHEHIYPKFAKNIGETQFGHQRIII